MSETVCVAKHTRPQIPDAEWRCPKCGATPDSPKGFVIEDSAAQSDPECVLLHDDDGLFCYSCDYDTSGKAFARAYAKRKSLVPCEHCKGSGFAAESR